MQFKESLNHQCGFTLIELLLVIGISAVLITIGTVNLVNIQHNTSVATAAETIIADLKSQQTKAMHGASPDGSDGNNYGIAFNGNSYTFFHGTSATPDYTANLDSNISVNPPIIIIFLSLSGELKTPAQNTIVVTNTTGSEQKTITLDKYGVVTSVN